MADSVVPVPSFTSLDGDCSMKAPSLATGSTSCIPTPEYLGLQSDIPFYTNPRSVDLQYISSP
jgi:hypothetical protein